MNMRRLAGILGIAGFLVVGTSFAYGDDPPHIVADLSGYKPECAVAVNVEGERLQVKWRTAEGESALLSLRLRAGKPLIEELAVAEIRGLKRFPILEDADPTVSMTVGRREQGKNRPPSMSVFNEFFDNPHTRPSRNHQGEFTLKRVKVTSTLERATIQLGDLKIGPFTGEWWITVFADCALVKIEAVVKTEQDQVAYLYEEGIRSGSFSEGEAAWTDTAGKFVSSPWHRLEGMTTQAVRHRAIGFGVLGQSLVITPAPHQFFFPRDFTNNVHTTWIDAPKGGRGGMGIRQDSTGGGNFVPWFNAPPASQQHLSMFLHVRRGTVKANLETMLKYTRGDRFAEIPGHITYSSHYHMAITAAAMKAKANGLSSDKEPEYVRMFKDMNLNAIHLGEFHGDGHQYDPGPQRLPELHAMFDECRRLSTDKLLFIPGEEIAKFIGKAVKGRESGHWMSLFPKPVYWILDRKPDQPFVTEDPTYGKVYRVGSSEDVQKVLDAENGLIWTAHPRIKSSSWAPDAFFDEPYFQAETFLGAAWKAMPADLSKDRLGTRGLDLLNDMANLGLKKYLPGEVDVFTLDHTHELYGHMNINYLEIDRLPKFDDGWKPISDALRRGQFFTTTGEVLITGFTFSGKKSGETVVNDPSKRQMYKFAIDCTYPLEFAEVIVGDGKDVRRDRITLDGTRAFSKFDLMGVVDLKGAKWLRVEAWDVAGNGAFTQPVWIK